MTRIFFIIHWFTFFYLVALNGTAMAKEAMSDVVEISITTKGKQLLNKNLFGFNQSSPPLKNISIKDFYSWDLVNDLKPVRMRFPGGTEANFYRWGIDRFMPTDLDVYSFQDSEYNRKVFEKFGPAGEKIGFQDYVDWLLKNKVKSSFVLNLSTDPGLTDALNVLKSVESRGVEVRNIELGNELYFPGQGGSKFKDPSIYASLVDTSCKQIKLSLPNAKCGVATWGILYGGKMTPWDVKLSKNCNYFDALVFHIYFKQEIIPEKYLGSPAFFYTESGFPALLAAYRSVFPQKEFWITEWNIDNTSANINKTLFGTIFAADFFMALVRQPDVTIANYHALLGNTHCLLEVYYHYKNKPFFAEKNLPYYLWLSIGKIFSSCDSYTEPSVVASDEPRAVNAMAFSGSGKMYLLLTNRSDRAKAIKLINPSAVVMANEAITGASLDYSLKNAMYQFRYDRSQGAGGLVVRPHSINFITIQK